MRDFFLLAAMVLGIEMASAEPLRLTPLLRVGKTQEARKLSKVVIGQEDMGYSGFFTVDSQTEGADRENHIFFWYQPCSNCTNVSESPLLVWLQGGPGGPGTFGAMTEIGQYWIDENLEVRERCFSWCAKHSCLFVDQPVEAGFSYQTVKSTGKAVTEMSDLDLTDNSPDAMKQIHSVIDQFLGVFDDLRDSPLIITGESYGGLYTPNLGVLLAEDEEINFTGLAVGDPCIDGSVQFSTYADTMYGLGAVDLKEREMIRGIMQKSVDALGEYASGKGTCRAAFDPWNSFWDDDGHDSGGATEGIFTQLTGSTMTEYILMNSSPSSFGDFSEWFAKPDVKKAFHVDGVQQPTDKTLALTVYDVFVKSGDWCNPTAGLYAKLLDSQKIDLMIYTSSMDPLLGPPMTEAGVESILDQVAHSKDMVDEYRESNKTLWSAGSDVAPSGFAKCAKNGDSRRFCYVVVKNSGHMTPAFTPRPALDMLNRFVLGASFEGKDSPDANDRLPTCAPCGGAGPFAGSAVCKNTASNEETR